MISRLSRWSDSPVSESDGYCFTAGVTADGWRKQKQSG
jgi:hypothetical protein